MSNWSAQILGDLIDVKHGFAFSGEHIREEPHGDILLTPGNFAIGGGFKDDKFKYFDGEVPSEYVLTEGDLIVTMTDLSKHADSLGYPAIVPKSEGRRFLHNQRIGKVLIKPGAQLSKKFLFYLLRTFGYRHEILASATGTTVRHTSPSRILAYRAEIPPLTEQEAIAAVLGSLDDKIELNRQINKTLEAIVRALFQSWFVDFGPVRAKMEGRDPGVPKRLADLFPARLVDSEIGEIPEGWSVVSLPEAFEINPSRHIGKGEVASYLDMANMPTSGHVPKEVTRRPFGSGMRFTNGDTLVARITPCLENGKTAFVDFLNVGEIGWGSTEYIVLRSKPPLPEEFAYCLARSTRFREFAIHRMTGSSGRQRVPADSLTHFLLAKPPADIAKEFGAAVRPLFARAAANAPGSRCLSDLRDALLPRLMSGLLGAERMSARAKNRHGELES